jgi:hypothetical protein
MQAFTGGPGGLDPQALFQANFNLGQAAIEALGAPPPLAGHFTGAGWQVGVARAPPTPTRATRSGARIASPPAPRRRPA